MRKSVLKFILNKVVLLLLALVTGTFFLPTNHSWHAIGVSYSEEGKNHPAEWSSTHGKNYYKSKEECKACHGEELTGGDTKIDCGTCHPNPKHPKGWLNEHGTKYLDNRKQCSTCHGKQTFIPFETKPESPCARCHTTTIESDKWQPESHTSSVSVILSNNFRTSQDRFSNNDFATNHDLGIDLVEQNKQIHFTSQFHFEREWVGEEQNVNLYETNLQFDKLFKNHLSVTLGRQSFTSNVDYFLMDGISFYLTPLKWLDVSLTAGIPRFSEDADLDGEIGFVSGLSLIFKEFNYTNARIDFTYQKNSFSNTLTTNTDGKAYLGASISKGISIFKFYGLGQFDLNDTVPVTATVGTEIYPFSKKIGFLVEGNYYNESRSDNIESIFTLIAQDALWQLKAGIFVNTIKNLKLYQNFAFNRFGVLSGGDENGYHSETGADYLFKKINLETDIGYYFIKSYGGTLHGLKASLYEDWSRYFFSNLFFEYINYSKVTNNDDIGVNVILKSGVKINPGLRVSAAFEYAKNDVFEEDIRGTFWLDYYFNTRFKEWGKK